MSESNWDNGPPATTRYQIVYLIVVFLGIALIGGLIDLLTGG